MPAIGSSYSASMSAWRVINLKRRTFLAEPHGERNQSARLAATGRLPQRPRCSSSGKLTGRSSRRHASGRRLRQKKPMGRLFRRRRKASPKYPHKMPRLPENRPRLRSGQSLSPLSELPCEAGPLSSTASRTTAKVGARTRHFPGRRGCTTPGIATRSVPARLACFFRSGLWSGSALSAKAYSLLIDENITKIIITNYRRSLPAKIVNQPEVVLC